MATKQLNIKEISVSATDESNGYLDVHPTEIGRVMVFRDGANDTNFIENSPSDGKITLNSLNEGEKVGIWYLF